MLKKLLGLDGESGGFYLELDESKSTQNNNGATAVATKPAPKVEPTTQAPTVQKTEPAAPAKPKKEPTTKKAAAKVETPAPAPAPAKEVEPAPVAAKKTAKAKAVVAEVPTGNDSVAVNDKYRQSVAGNQFVELTRVPSKENLELVIVAAYKQVFGNAHVMDSERSPILESELRNGEITVSEFVRRLAQSDHYRASFFDKYPNVTAVELNFKHLLGRAPKNHAEISEHIQILAEGGFAAEIDSYIDSEEYFQNFGEYTVPYYRGYDSQSATNVVSFTHSFQVLQGACSSSKSTFEGAVPKLQASLAQNAPSAIAVPREIPDSFPESLIMAPPKPPKTIPDVEELIANAVGISYWGIPAVIPEKAKPTVSKPAAEPEPKEAVTEKAVEEKVASEAAPQETKAEATFSTDYMIAKPAPNRRPGPSINKFIAITRKMRIRK